MNTPVLHRFKLYEPLDGISLCVLTSIDAETQKIRDHEFLIDATGANLLIEAFTALVNRLNENLQVKA